MYQSIVIKMSILPECYLAAGDYISFGISGSESSSVMIGADVTVVYITQQGMPKAEDYFLSDKSQVRQFIEKGCGCLGKIYKKNYCYPQFPVNGHD